MTEKTTDRTNLNSLPKMQTVGKTLGEDFLTRAIMPSFPVAAPSMSPETAASIRAGIKELIREVVREIVQEELDAREAQQNGK